MIGVAESVRPDMAALGGFLLGYALVLVTPGPNMILIGAFSALRGFRAALPVACGIGLGSGTLALVVHSVSGVLPSGGVWDLGGRLVGAALLAWIGWRIAHCPTPTGETDLSAAPSAEFAAGFLTAITNPITAAYFASQFFGPVGVLPAVDAAGLGGLIAGLAFGKAALVAAVLAHCGARRRLLRAFRPVTLAIGCAFGILAVRMATPALAAVMP